MAFYKRTTVPPAKDPFYIRADTPNAYGVTGYSRCILCADPYLNVLPNCVGYACGRFNEIIGEMKYPYFNCDAKGFIKRAREMYPGLQISAKPTLGGIMVWGGVTTGNQYTECGHVAVVEELVNSSTIVVSESNYSETNTRGTNPFWRLSTIQNNSNWAYYGMKFMGCIVNPSVSNGDIVEILADGGAMSEMTYASVAWPSLQKHAATKTYKTKYKEVKTVVTRDTLKHTDEDLAESKSTSLLSYPALVQSPFIIVDINGITFGSAMKEGDINKLNSKVTVQFPNFIKSINIVKINGKVNQYTIDMMYQIQPGQDPNYLDKVFSSVGFGTIKISYGDWMSPMFIYKEEEALITNLDSKVDFHSSQITYTLSCTSNSLSLSGGTFSFPARTAKPSDLIKEILYSNTYGLRDIFYGMKNKTLVDRYGLIASDDQRVEIDAKESIDVLSYINYLVTYMTSNEDSTDSPLKTATYYMSIHDDAYGYGDLGGPYFKVTKVKSEGKTLSSSDTYEVDVGYPGENLVTNFSINDQNSWALLYNYSDSIEQNKYVYSIDNEGNIRTEHSPSVTTSAVKYRTTAAQKTWWTNMTRFPVTATITFRGLIRPTMLMTKLRVNAFFYGQRHTSSGLYVITKQEDSVSGEGYKTTLTLLKIGGDQDWYEKNTQEITHKVPYMVYS